MSDTYTPSTTNNPSSYTVPADGDILDVASILPAIEGIADELQWVKQGNVSSATNVVRHYLPEPVPHNQASGVTDATRASAWRELATGGGGVIQIIKSRFNTASGDEFLIPLDLPAKATIQRVFITCRGFSGSDSDPTPPTYRLIRFDMTGQTLDFLSSTITDGHTFGGSSDWLTADFATEIPGTGSNLVVIPESYTYVLFVVSPYKASTGGQMSITDVQVNLTPGGLALK